MRVINFEASACSFPNREAGESISSFWGQLRRLEVGENSMLPWCQGCSVTCWEITVGAGPR